MEERDGARREFTTTRWSVVLRAGGSDAEQSLAALETLCRDYWYPIYACVRRKGYDAHAASDLTQEFFHKLLANGFAEGLTREGGRFRSFLLTALDRFVATQWQKQQRAKRGGGVGMNSLDALIAERGEASYVREASHQETPERLFQRAWAETLLTRVLDRLASECAARGDGRFEELKRYLSAGDAPPSLAKTAEALGLTVPAFKSLLHRFRQRYRELLIAEIAQTVRTRSEVAEEMQGLLQVLRNE